MDLDHSLRILQSIKHNGHAQMAQTFSPHFLPSPTLPVVPVRERENGAGVRGLLPQGSQNCELWRATQQLGRALERRALHLQRPRVSWNGKKKLA